MVYTRRSHSQGLQYRGLFNNTITKDLDWCHHEATLDHGSCCLHHHPVTNTNSARKKHYWQTVEWFVFPLTSFTSEIIGKVTLKAHKTRNKSRSFRSSFDRTSNLLNLERNLRASYFYMIHKSLFETNRGNWEHPWNFESPPRGTQTGRININT